MRQLKILFFIIFFCSYSYGQSKPSDSLLIKKAELIKILNQADTLQPEDIYGENGIDINGRIAAKLTEILSIPSIVNYRIDSLLEHQFLGITYSSDKRLWIFNWYENTGGSFKSNSSLIYYKNESNKAKISYTNDSEDDANKFCSEGARFTKIVKLKSKKNIYLCLGSTVGCNTCCAEVASVIELTNDSILYNYPAFSNLKSDSYSVSKDSSPCFVLDSRCGDIITFEYNSKTQTIYYSYNSDDRTPINILDTEKSILINGKLKWTGETFIETIKKY